MAEETQVERPNSYRDLLRLKANGFAVDDYDVFLWRREEEIIRSAIHFPNHYRSSGVEYSWFQAALHRTAWQALAKLIAEPRQLEEIDPGILLSHMRTIDNGLDGHKGQQWIYAIKAELPVAPEFVLEQHVRDIYRSNRLRVWGGIHNRLSARIGKDTDLAGLESEIVSNSNNYVNQVQGEGGYEAPLSEMQWDARDKDKVRVVKTGIAKLDRGCGGGIGLGEMLVWGAGTNVGKSASAQRILRNQPRLRQNALYISVEDSKELMFCRTVADFSEPSIEPVTVRDRTADPEIVERAIARMRDELKGHVTVLERKKATIGQVCREIQYYRYVRDIQLVILDYLQAVTEDEPTVNKTAEMASVTSKLKRCITQCGVALIVYSQLARNEYREGTEPQLTSAKHSGEIENETENLVMMWRDLDGRIHAKLPKVKWTRLRHSRFLIPVNDVTGCHGEWEDDFEEPEQEPKKGKTPRD